MSECTLQRVVMPGQANTRGSLFGGLLLAWMDEAAAIAAMRHAALPVVTAHMNSVDFKAPILVAEVTREKHFCTTAEFVMVAVDEDRRPTPVPPTAQE